MTSTYTDRQKRYYETHKEEIQSRRKQERVFVFPYKGETILVRPKQMQAIVLESNMVINLSYNVIDRPIK